MRTIISLALAILIHLLLVFFLLPKKQITEVQFSTNPSVVKGIEILKFHKQEHKSQLQKQQNLPLESQSSANIDRKVPLGDSDTQTSISTATGVEKALNALERPPYPRIARMKGLEGKVKIKIIFDKNGQVSSVTILESSNHLLLDESVKNTALKWKDITLHDSALEKTFEFKLNN